MADRNILDFRAQAEQMIRFIENKLELGQRQSALELINLKFKLIYEQGVMQGQLYEKEGESPYTILNN